MTGETPDSDDDLDVLLNQNKPGSALRALREQKGIALEQITEQSLIPQRKLEELEQDNYQSLGGATFVNGYIRKYAKLLDADSDAFIAALPAEMTAVTTASVPSGESDLSRDGSSQSKRHFLSAINGIPGPAAVAFLLLVWGGVVFFTGGDATPDHEEVVAPTEIPSQSMPSPAATELEIGALTETEGDAIEEGASNSAAPIMLAVTPEPNLAPQTTSIPEPQATPPLQAAAAVQQQANTDQDLLFVTFLEDCWIEVSDAQGEVVFAQLKTKGDNLQLFGEAPFEVMLGNARAAEMLINGNPVAINPIPNRNTLRFTVNP